MEIIHQFPQLSEILQEVSVKIREMLACPDSSQWGFRLMPTDKVNSDREIDIALEIALQFGANLKLKQSVVCQTDGVIESLQATLPPVFTYTGEPEGETWLSVESVQYILDSLESVAGPLIYFESEPGCCYLYYAQGSIFFLRRGLH